MEIIKEITTHHGKAQIIKEGEDEFYVKTDECYVILIMPWNTVAYPEKKPEPMTLEEANLSLKHVATDSDWVHEATTGNKQE